MQKPFAYALTFAGAVLLLSLAPPTASLGQTGAGDDATAKLIEEVAAQQTKIVANQTAMDEKIAAVAEEVRQARLFVARGGGTRK